MKKYKDQYSPFIYWLTKHITNFMARRRQNIQIYCPPELRKLPGPFIVCGNHVGLWDPFLLCYPFTYRCGIRYITSDAAFRKRLKGWYLKKLGCIPKTKGVRDSETIRIIFEVIKKKQVIGIFPEGDRSYDGKTMPLDSATGKLLKKLNLPVLACINKGTSFSQPRWSAQSNKGRVEFHYSLLFTPEQLAALDADTIQQQLVVALAHDDTVWQQEHQIRYNGGRRAQFLEHPLFLCPSCRGIATIRSNKDAFICTQCNHKWRVNEFGFFESEGEVYHGNLRDWFAWQKRELAKILEMAGDNDEVFRDPDCTLLSGYKSDPLTELGKGTATLTGSGLRFIPADGGEALVFPAAEMKGITVLEGETTEFYHGEHCIQLSFKGLVSACKWVTSLLLLHEQTTAS